MSVNKSSSRSSLRKNQQITTTTPNKDENDKNKEIKSSLERSFQEFTKELNKRLEDLRSEFDLLTNNLNAWEATLREDVRKVEEEIKSIKRHQAELNSGLDETKLNCTNLRQSIETLKTDYDNQKGLTNQLQKDLDKLKTDSLVERQSDRASIASLREEIHKLRNEKQQEIDSLRSKVCSLEAEKTSLNLILSGRLIPAAVHGEDTVSVALNVLKTHLNYVLPRNQVSTAYRLGSQPENHVQDHRKIILKLDEAHLKRDLFSSYKTVRVDGLYINEELTSEVNNLYYQLRQMRKRNHNVFYRLFTRDGVIKVRKSATGKTYSIVTKDQFDIFIRDSDL